MSDKIYIIAELGNTHDGSLGTAKQLIKSAAECGVNAVKIQTHIFSSESLSNAPSPPYFIDESREDYFARTSFTQNQYFELKEFAQTNCNVDFLSSPFSVDAVQFLEDVGISRYKIPSGEVTNLPLLEAVASTNKPVILSSGMSPWDDINLAVSTLQENGVEDLSLLQCSSIYPCPPNDVGLNIMLEFNERYNLPVGYSDHTLGMAAPFAAASLGAKIIEKHFTLSTLMYGSDAKHSMEPTEFKAMVDGLREIELMLSNPVDKNQLAKDLVNMKLIFEKSLVVSKAIRKGEAFTYSNLTTKKPGDGIPASKFHEVLGKKASYDMQVDHVISEKSYYE